MSRECLVHERAAAAVEQCQGAGLGLGVTAGRRRRTGAGHVGWGSLGMELVALTTVQLAVQLLQAVCPLLCLNLAEHMLKRPPFLLHPLQLLLLLLLPLLSLGLVPLPPAQAPAKCCWALAQPWHVPLT